MEKKKKKILSMKFLFLLHHLKKRKKERHLCKNSCIFLSSHSGFYVHIHIHFSKGIPRNANRNIIATRQESSQSPEFPPESRIHLLKDT